MRYSKTITFDMVFCVMARPVHNFIFSLSFFVLFINDIQMRLHFNRCFSFFIFCTRFARAHFLSIASVQFISSHSLRCDNIARFYTLASTFDSFLRRLMLLWCILVPVFY